MPIRGMPDKREQDKEKLRELAFIDDLTLVYNRRYLYRYLPTELEDIKRLGRELSLFMIDVDTFKEVNDIYGHLSGDKILTEIAEILHKSLRKEDTVIRYAGDEFIAILPGADEDVATNIAERIVEKIDKTRFRVSEGKTNVHITISIGLAFFPRDAQDPEKLIYQADRALYSSKSGGRNRICTAGDIPTEILDETKLQEIFPSPQLIGRASQLDRLKELLDEAEKGQLRLALVKGERGIGKTRLISEFKKYAQAESITCIGASCSPEISNQPYQILISALGNLFTSLGPEVREFISSLPEAQIVQLANYIPALRQFLPKEVKAVKVSSEEQAQIDLFKGICQSLIYGVRRNTFLLIIDDFHWIDKETLQLLDYMIKDLRSIPIFIIVAYQEEELKKRTDSTSLKELLYQMKQSKSVDELALEALEKEDILKMVTAIFTGLQIRPEFVNIVYDVSAGNPLFTEEALRSLVNKGLIFYQDGKWHIREISEASLPSFLKEAIQKRVILLDEETKPVISAAAVIGQIFDFDVLCQLLEKDPGYILEVIDRATKQHIILPESPFQSDKFKFNSEAIWDIIYASLDSEKKRELHKRLALIEESRYKDNVGTVAGSLGYHFGKARLTEKANLYVNMLSEKAARMPNYEEAFGFLQEALSEEPEEIVVPLSGASMKLIPAMVRSLRLAAQNVRLYPAHSEIRKGFVDRTHKYLTDILAGDGTLIIGTIENRLFINGEEITEKATREAGAAAFVALMIAYRIKSITFKEDLTKEQLVILLEGLNRNYDDLMVLGGLSGMLRKNGVSGIRINEIHYAETGKISKQRSKFEEAMLIDYLMGKVSNLEGDETEIITQLANDPERLTQALKKVARVTRRETGKDNTQTQADTIAQSLQKLSGQVLSQPKEEIGQYRKNIAKAVMGLDHKLRSKVIQTPAATGKATLKDIIEEFSDEQILEMVTREFFESGGSLAKMQSFVRQFLLDPRRKQRLLPKLKAKLLQLGMNEEEVSWVLEGDIWQGLSLEKKVKRLKSLSAGDYMKFDISKEIEDIISELLKNGRYNEAGEIVDKLLKQLEDESNKARRLLTLNDLDTISEMLIFKEKYFLLEQIINSLIVRLDKEKDPEVYSSVIQVLANICTKLIKRQNFIQATGILKEFNLRLGKTSKMLDIQKQAIKKARDRTVTSSGVVNWLAKLLEEKIEGRHDFWELSKVMVEIGNAAVEPIFTLAVSKDSYADPFKTYALRWSIAKVLKGIGDEAVFYLKDRLAEKEVQHNKVALELLGHMQNKSALKYLHPLLKHKDLSVRKEAIATLGKIGGIEAIKLLSESIKDKNSRIRLASIWALANIGSPEVLPILKPLLKEKEFSNEVRKVIQRIEKR